MSDFMRKAVTFYNKFYEVVQRDEAHLKITAPEHYLTFEVVDNGFTLQIECHAIIEGNPYSKGVRYLHNMEEWNAYPHVYNMVDKLAGALADAMMYTVFFKQEGEEE